ncbi:hypothetical protein PSU4_41140 [Pseudonocardia sulfidoxydans NBRC 16205]|uniref:HTH araC/xylS-type domain-containing protein n=1 Tax=Pseudonocardia sulfidoxydans NBRC 16205 TaxID=1223511 RepID=A0A511DK13_9PSEU|nr:hypothetical protein PSU4_41140 [Pseudonocardia sulfidoxydans NBRC 16205]
MLSAVPPPIPASRKVARWDAHAREHLLMWVHTGRAHVRLGSGELHRVNEGTGIWLPPGADHEMWTDADSLALPLSVPAVAVPGAPDRVVRFAVDERWRDWLVAQYAQRMQDQPRGPGPDLLAVLTAAGPELPQNSPGGAVAGEDDPPAAPRTGAAAAVARALRRRPSLDLTIEEWAAATACSPSTLRRQFLQGTGLPFGQWRALWRLAAARNHLTAGGSVSDAAALAGFTSRQSFARAFRERYGDAPRSYAMQHRSEAPAMSAPAGVREVPPNGPTVRTRGIAARNELIWIYRGEGSSHVGDRSVATRRGDALWLPAGMPYENVLPAGAVAVSLGEVRGDCAAVPEPLRARFPPSWDAYLLHCSVSANTLLHPDGYHVRHVVDLFDAQLAVERARAVPLPRHVHARAAAEGYLRRIGARTDDAAYDDVPPGVHAAFRLETGLTFAGWRHATRMRVARDLLTAGTRPGAVAGQVGYRDPANFSRAFARFHGMSPGEWQAHELAQSAG